MTDKKVHFSGAEYVNYLKYKQKNPLFTMPQLKVGQWVGVIIILTSLLFGALAMIFMFPHEPTPQTFSGWYSELVPIIAKNPTFTNIAKIFLLYSAPWLTVGIIIAWIIHGVGFHVVKL